MAFVRRPIFFILTVSAIAISALFWLIYFRPAIGHAPAFVHYLPAMNALFNLLSTFFIIGGVVAVKNGKITLHKRCMLSAFVSSTFFLVGYVVYHSFFGDSKFHGVGFIRYIYFSILLSHILLTIVVLPLVLTTFYVALANRIPVHQKVARWTYPLWLYVSVTGVLIFGFLKIL